MTNPQQRKIARIVKSMKWAAGAFFLGANIYLAYKFSTAYTSGQQRAEKLHKERQALKSQGKQTKTKLAMPQQTKPEYVQKQVRKYKQMVQGGKQREPKQ